MFHEGQWFIDLNGNGQWDESDLWAKLGSEHDRPVTGDWDGDGKTDIGIYGPAWPGDPVHIEREPGLPDAGQPRTRQAASEKHAAESRTTRPTASGCCGCTSQGKERADLIDHVFQLRRAAATCRSPATGTATAFARSASSATANGTSTWTATAAGPTATRRPQFGQAGDMPVVGDFNGDGVDEIGVFRNGKWIIDTNGNHQIDAEDKVFEFGGAGDKPVVGDWDGDGTDEPAVFRAGQK